MVFILIMLTAGLDKNLAEKLLADVIANANKKNRTLIIFTHDAMGIKNVELRIKNFS